MTFGEVKDKYIELRENERNKLVKYLQKKDSFEIVSGSRSGKGIRNYTSQGRIDKHNLSNWKWVELNKKERKEYKCIISLNMPEQDSSSLNHHALYDRIGLFITGRTDEYGIDERQIITNIELPLNEKKLKDIYEILMKVL